MKTVEYYFSNGQEYRSYHNGSNRRSQKYQVPKCKLRNQVELNKKTNSKCKLSHFTQLI